MSVYRVGSGRACPQCAQPLDLSDERAACPNDCGEWVPRAWLGRTVGELAWTKHDPGPKQAWWKAESEVRDYAPPPCPECGGPLERAWVGPVPVRACDAHGLWVAAAASEAFEARLEAPRAYHERLAEQVARLEQASPEDRVAIAKELLALDERVRQLERELLERDRDD